MKKTLVVLAAGLGSRYGGIKQIAPIGPNGEILIHYAIHDAVAAGFSKIVFIIKRDIEQDFKEAIGAFAEAQAEVYYAFQDEAYLPMGYIFPPERKKMLGTVHALLAAKDILQEPFAIINADDYYGKEAYGICAQQLEKIMDSHDSHAACMVGYLLKNTISSNGTVNRGICRTEGNRLIGLTETYHIMPKEDGTIVSNYGTDREQPLEAEGIVSMNFWGFQPSILSDAQALFDRFIANLPAQDLTSEYVLPTMVDDLLRAGLLRVDVLPCKDSWLGITYPTDREKVSRQIMQMQNAGLYPACLK